MHCFQKKYLVPTIIVVALVAWYAYAFHQPHLLAALPFLFILACPLMHIFMMRGHGAHDEKTDTKTNDKKSCH